MIPKCTRTFCGEKCSSTFFQATIGSPTTCDSAIGSPTTRDLATGLFEKWCSHQKLLRPKAENRKFRQDWLGGTRGFVTIKYVGNEFLFPTILGNEFSFPRASTGNKGEAGVLPHYLTHQASARGGDGHRIIPHTGHQLVEGMGTLSFLQAGRSCSTRLRDLHCPDVVIGTNNYRSSSAQGLLP